MEAIPTNVPLLPPPAGKVTNFAAADFQPVLIGIHAAFLSLMVVVLALRLWIRGVVIKSLWWEDYMVVAAAIVTIVNSVLILTLLDIGYGKHAWNVALINLVPQSHVKRFIAPGLTYPLAILLIKLSVSLLYWRIFSISGKYFRLATLFIIAFCTVFYLGIFAYLAAIFNLCSDVTSSNPNCSTGTQLITWIVGIVNVVTDLYLLALPVVPLAGLQHVSGRKKLAVWIMFSAGGLATAASVARLAVTLSLLHGTDVLYIDAVENVPSTIELCLGIVAASIPTLGKIQESSTIRKVVVTFKSYASTLSLAGKSSRNNSENSTNPSFQSTEETDGKAAVC